MFNIIGDTIDLKTKVVLKNDDHNNENENTKRKENLNLSNWFKL